MQHDNADALQRSISGAELVHSSSMSKRVAQGLVVQLNPQTKQIVGAINQAKKEQAEGIFDSERQKYFIDYLNANDDLPGTNFPDSVWTDLFKIFERVLMTINIVQQTRNISPENTSIHVAIIKLMLWLLQEEPSRVKFLNLDQESYLEALLVTRLIQSPNKETVMLGVNFCMLLVHHAENLTLVDLIKFDMSSKDRILKHESIKIWNAINSVSEQISHPLVQHMQELDERNEAEQEAFETRISKQIHGFVANKMSQVDAKMETQNVSIKLQEGALKGQDARFKTELAKVKRQIEDLGNGKITTQAELQEVERQQAIVDEQQDIAFLQFKNDIDAKIVALQKEIKKVKMGATASPSGGLAAVIARQVSGSGSDYLQRMNSVGLHGGAIIDTTHLETKLVDHEKEISQLKRKLEEFMADSSGGRGDNVFKAVAVTKRQENGLDSAELKTQLEKQIKNIEDRTRKGFQMMKVQLDKMKEDAKKVDGVRAPVTDAAQPASKEVLDIAEITSTTLESLQNQLEAFRNETRTAMEEMQIAATTPLQPEKPRQEESQVPLLQVAANAEDTKTAVLTEVKTMVSQLEDRVKKGFAKVKEDQTKIKKEMQEAKTAQEKTIPSVEKCIDDVESLTAKIDSFQIEAKSALQTLKSATETAQEETKVALEQLKTQAPAAKPQVSGTVHSDSTEDTKTAVLTEVKTMVSQLEDRVKKGFAKVKEDQTKIKNDMTAAKSVQEDQVPKIEKCLLELSELATHLQDFKTETKTALAEAKSALPTNLSEDIDKLKQQAQQTSLSQAEPAQATTIASSPVEQQAATHVDIDSVKATFQEELTKLKEEAEKMKTQVGEFSATQTTQNENLNAKVNEMASKAGESADSLRTTISQLATDLTDSKALNAEGQKSLAETIDEFKKEAIGSQLALDAKVVKIEQRLDRKLLDLTADQDAKKLQTLTSEVTKDAVSVELPESAKNTAEATKREVPAASTVENELQTQVAELRAQLSTLEAELSGNLKQLIQTEIEKLKEVAHVEPQVSEPPQAPSPTPAETMQAETTPIQAQQEQSTPEEPTLVAAVAQASTSEPITAQPSEIEESKTLEQLASLRAQIDQIVAKSELLEEKVRKEAIDLEIKFNQLKKQMETEKAAISPSVEQQPPSESSPSQDEASKRVSELEAQILGQSAVLDTLRNSIEELKTAGGVSQGIKEVSQSASASDLEEIQVKLTQLEEATKEAKSLISDLEKKTESTIATIGTKSAAVVPEQKAPETSPDSQPEHEVKVSSASEGGRSMQELEKRLLEAVQVQREKTDKVVEKLMGDFQAIISEEKDQKESRGDEITAVSEKLDTHIKYVKTKMEKQGDLFKKLVLQVQQTQEGSPNVSAVDPDTAERKTPILSPAGGIDADDHFELKDRVENLSQEIETFQKSIEEIIKTVKRSDEQNNQKISTTELQQLREEFENLTHDLRNQMLAIETTQKGVLSTFEELKACTDGDIKTLEEKSFTELAKLEKQISEGLTAAKDTADKSFLTIAAFEKFTETSNAGSKSQKEETGTQLKSLEEKLVEVQKHLNEKVEEDRVQNGSKLESLEDKLSEMKESLTEKTEEQLAELKHDLESLLEKSNATNEDETKKLQESIVEWSAQLNATVDKELKKLEESLEKQTSELTTTMTAEMKTLADGQEKQSAEWKEKDEQMTLRQTEFEQDLSRQIQEIDNIKSKVDEQSQADAAQFVGIDKKIRGLHKKIKGEHEESFGKIKAELSLYASYHKVADEKLTQMERYLDRIRCSNTYGEPITNFNEDSATKTEMQDFVKAEVAKVLKKLKDVKRSTLTSESLIQDLQEDTAMLKNIGKKHQEKMDEVQVVAELKGATRSYNVSPRNNGEQMDSSKLKRILQLIENNSKAMALQRETFANLMVRIQMLEKAIGKRAGQIKSHSAVRTPGLPVDMSKNNYSSLTGGKESTDASFTLILPPAIDSRHNSLNRHETPTSRNFSNRRTVELPKSLKAANAVNESDLGLYEASPTKRSQIRANLYGNQIQNETGGSSGLSAIKAKRFSHQVPSSMKGAQEKYGGAPKSRDFQL